jgi:predicted transcriptional regulator
MACINPDGTLTPAAQAVITALKAACTVTDLAQATSLPIYRIRSTLRELGEEGLVSEIDEKYLLTEVGKNKLSY